MVKTLSFGHPELSIAAAAALLAGCGFIQPPQYAMPPMGAPGTTERMPRQAKNEDLLYVSNPLFDQVWVFTYPAGRPVENLTGFAFPESICVDKRGDVFVSDLLADRIQEYAHGGSTPIQTLRFAGNPEGCAVDPLTGNLAVVKYTSQAPGDIEIFHEAKGAPTLYSDPSFASFENCGYDGDGNLFADGLTNGNQSGLAELSKGTVTFQNIALEKSFDAVGSVQRDGKHLAIMSNSGDRIYQLAISRSSAKIVGRTSLEVARHEDAFWIEDSRVVVTYYPPHSKYTAVGFWRYPAGGSPVKVLSPLPGVTSIGVSLAAR